MIMWIVFVYAVLVVVTFLVLTMIATYPTSRDFLWIEVASYSLLWPIWVVVLFIRTVKWTIAELFK